MASATPEAKVVALSEKDSGPYVELSLENVRSRADPLFLEVNLFLSRGPGRPLNPKLKEFLRYVLGREGQDAVQRDGIWLPLTGKVVRDELAKLE